MAIPYNGSQYALRFKRENDVDFNVIALQKDLSADFTRKKINYDNKTSGDREVYLTGIASETLKTQVFISNDASYQDLYDAADTGELITVAVYRTVDSDNIHPSDDEAEWELYKSATALIEKLSEKYAHENIAMADLDVAISGRWTFA